MSSKHWRTKRSHKNKVRKVFEVIGTVVKVVIKKQGMADTVYLDDSSMKKDVLHVIRVHRQTQSHSLSKPPPQSPSHQGRVKTIELHINTIAECYSYWAYSAITSSSGYVALLRGRFDCHSIDTQSKQRKIKLKQQFLNVTPDCLMLFVTVYEGT